MHAVHNPFAAGLRITLLLSWLLLLTPVLVLARLTGRPSLVLAVARMVYRGLLAATGFRLDISGRICTDKPVLYVANHLSYFDIMVLGSLLDANFVAKQEVGRWPLIGMLARISGTVFVERRARHSRSQRDAMTARLEQRQESLILFPEGTSGDGRAVLTFKSSLFSAAASCGGALPVQPISLAYTRLDGMPLGRGLRPHYAWYGDMELASHIWVALGLGRATVRVLFHPPTTLAAWPSRKALADHCRQVIGRGVIAAHGGKQLIAADGGKQLIAADGGKQLIAADGGEQRS